MMNVSFLERPPTHSEVEHWEWEPAVNPYPNWNLPLARLLGRPVPSTGNLKSWLDWVLEDDRPAAFERAESWVNAPDCTPLVLQFRARSASGLEPVHVVVQGTVMERGPDKRPSRIIGAVVNTTRQVLARKELRDLSDHLNLVITSIYAGVWEWEIRSNLLRWSPRFYELMGYSPDDLPASYATFLEVLLHPDDRPALEKAITEHLRYHTPYRIDIRMKTRLGGYRWFETSGLCRRDEKGSPVWMTGSVFDIDQKKRSLLELEKREFILSEAGAMARIGGWELDLNTGQLWWSAEVRRIHEVQPDFETSLQASIDFYTEEFRPVVRQILEDCITRKCPWDMEFQIITARKRKIWIRTMGKPVLDDQGQVVGVRGVLKDDDRNKKRELSLQKSLNLIRGQNHRLFNFAHIISHNLRLHSSNLNLMVELLNETTSEAEKDELIDQIRAISGNLDQTISHLNEVVTIRSTTEQQRKTIRLDEALAEVLATLAPDFPDLAEAVSSDFSQAQEIDYLPEYLASILSNLLSNAGRYRHPERPLQVHLLTRWERGYFVLEVSDNGLGIDLQQYGAKLFGLYNTFHEHPEARGFGLFLTRNYVEALGGRIEVTSQPDVGTTFTVTF